MVSVPGNILFHASSRIVLPFERHESSKNAARCANISVEQRAAFPVVVLGAGLVGALLPWSSSKRRLYFPHALRKSYCPMASKQNAKSVRDPVKMSRHASNANEEISEAQRKMLAFSSLLQDEPSICEDTDDPDTCEIYDPEMEEADDDLNRMLKEAKEEGEELNEALRWHEQHPERSADVAKAMDVTETRQELFEDDGTVDPLLVAFMRDVRIRAQTIDREVPAGVKSKVIHLLRHGQGFHNMMDKQSGMEGVLGQPPLPKRVTQDGTTWLVAPAFDELFTENLGSRIVAGIETSGVADFAIAFSADYGITWNELPPMRNPNTRQKHRELLGKVKCTHVRLRALNSDLPEEATLSILTPILSRPELLDPSLTAQGRSEALSAHKYALLNDLKPDLIVVSPITRATQTAFIVFQHLLDDTGKPKGNLRFVAHEGVHERGGENACDRRRPLRDLKRDFPYVDYSYIETEEDPTWSALRETQSSMIKRAYNFLLWLRDRPEKEVAIAAHCGINFTMLNAIVDCSMDPKLAAWFVTAELRSLRILWEEPPPAESKFIDSSNRIFGLGDGMSCLYPHIIQLEPDGPSEDVIVLRRDFNQHSAAGRVSVISGGGAGHEPAVSGFVGEGLLTGGVTGGVFASPSPHSLFRAIMASSGEAGCVLIMKNYPGVTFYSGVAAERAKSLGVKVEVVLVGDDVGTVTKVATKDARGSAGALLTIKVACACAEQGGSLSEVVEAAQSVAARTRTMGLAMRWNRAEEPSLEIGVGIHGESGSTKLPSVRQLPGGEGNRFASASIQSVLDRLVLSEWPSGGQRVVALLNNLGGCSGLEMGVLCRALHVQLEARSLILEGLVQGTLMSCQDMHGFSLSLLPVESGQVLDMLTAPVASMTAWPGLVREPRPLWLSNEALNELKPQPVRSAHSVPEAGSYAWLLREAIKAACRTLSSGVTVNALNQMDGGCGDGAPDMGTGNTHRDMALAILSRIDNVPCEDASEALLFLAGEAEASWRGIVSGIYMLAFTAAGQRLRELGQKEPAVDGWAQAGRAALSSVQRYGGAQEGDRTLIDAWLPAVLALEKHSSATCEKAMEKAVKAARKGARATQQMLAKKGRAQYARPSTQARWQDPGAVGVAKWLEAVQKSLRANSVAAPSEPGP